jgi:hypothetical protein
VEVSGEVTAVGTYCEAGMRDLSKSAAGLILTTAELREVFEGNLDGFEGD